MQLRNFLSQIIGPWSFSSKSASWLPAPLTETVCTRQTAEQTPWRDWKGSPGSRTSQLHEEWCFPTSSRSWEPKNISGAGGKKCWITRPLLSRHFILCLMTKFDVWIPRVSDTPQMRSQYRNAFQRQMQIIFKLFMPPRSPLERELTDCKYAETEATDTQNHRPQTTDEQKTSTEGPDN